MPKFIPLRRSLLLTLCLLSACAAGGVPGDSPVNSAGRLYGTFLEARFAESQFDLAKAAQYYRAAAAADPTDPVLHEHAFVTSLMAGDSAAESLVAKAQPDDQVAALFRVGEAARAGRWDAAIAGIKALPNEGLTEILRPLLLAWAE
ncbi:MAG: tetratricopeptide repeat protein, partial [Acetobacteraceae bacterium]